MNPNISMQTKRLSNIELLRVLAMLMVLALHANFKSLGCPTSTDIASSPLNAWMRIGCEQACIVAVDVFVLISGWFGIRASVKGFCCFLFTCLFFCIGVNVVMWGSGLQSWHAESLKTIYEKLEFDWFVKAYMLLYVLSPVLNAFTATASRRTQARVLIGFFCIQTFFGWIGLSDVYFTQGYSPLSFVGLYLLARYVAVFRPTWSKGSAKSLLIVYIALTAVQTIAGFGLLKCDISAINRLIWYNNPLVIAASLCLLLCFKEIHFQSRFVNRLAGSCFAVYLLHTHAALFGWYRQAAVWIYNYYSGGVFLLLLSIFLLTVFIVAVLIDQIRIRLWRSVEKCVGNKN